MAQQIRNKSLYLLNRKLNRTLASVQSKKEISVLVSGRSSLDWQRTGVGLAPVGLLDTLSRLSSERHATSGEIITTDGH